MKIKIKREIDIPDSFTCKNCKALNEYVVDSPNFRAANCANFNDKVFADLHSGWAFVKCRPCINAVLDYFNGATK